MVGRHVAYITEGPVDWLAAVAWHLPAFAICGTHFPTERLPALAEALAIYGVFDPDRAGQSAAERFAPLFGSRWRPVRLPNSLDLAELAALGSAGRESQRVLRATTSGGPYAQVTSFSSNSTRAYGLWADEWRDVLLRGPRDRSGEQRERELEPGERGTVGWQSGHDAADGAGDRTGGNAITKSRTLTATASDNAGGSGVASVQFQVSSDDGSTWTNVAPTHRGAVHDEPAEQPGGRRVPGQSAGDGQRTNQATSDAVSFRLDTTAPVVSMTAPTDGSTTSSKTLSASASDGTGSGVASVQFQTSSNGGASWSDVGSAVTSAPYTVTASSLVDGSYQAQATALDQAGNSTTAPRELHAGQHGAGEHRW